MHLHSLMRVGVFAGIFKHMFPIRNKSYVRAQLFKRNDDITKGIIKTIKYGIYANIFADKM